MKAITSHNFAQVPRAEIPRSTFDRSHGYKTTFDAGGLIPIYMDEGLPGDTHVLDLTCFARLSTPKTAIMDNLHMDFFFFSVPLRLLWTNFKHFMGEKIDPGDTTSYLVPTVDVAGEAVMSLSDYLGCIPGTTNPQVVAAFWHRAYNLIYNEWFRDNNLIDHVTVDVDNGPDTIADYQILNRGKRHDYFTSALPWPQAGDSVSLPLGTEAPVFGIGKGTQTFDETSITAYETGAAASTTYAKATYADQNSTNDYIAVEEDPDNNGFPGIFADLTNATASTVNELRQAFQVQKLLERDARGGTRYISKIKAHFGVTSPDYRMQRPEYLGGGHVPININPVTQTSQTDTTPQGTQAGFGVAAGSGIGFTASFTEHCVILGLASVRADLTYQQGIEKCLLRSTAYDFYWPVLAHLGEQAIQNMELWFTDEALGTDSVTNKATFGYQERYAEYRYKPSKITGLFRSDAASSLDVWHLSQDFGTLPVLDETFITEDPPIDRVVVTSSEPHIIYDSYLNLKSTRPMPVYGVPGFIDHL